MKYGIGRLFKFRKFRTVQCDTTRYVIPLFISKAMETIRLTSCFCCKPSYSQDWILEQCLKCLIHTRLASETAWLLLHWLCMLFYLVINVVIFWQQWKPMHLFRKHIQYGTGSFFVTFQVSGGGRQSCPGSLPISFLVSLKRLLGMVPGELHCVHSTCSFSKKLVSDNQN